MAGVYAVQQLTIPKVLRQGLLTWHGLHSYVMLLGQRTVQISEMIKLMYKIHSRWVKAVFVIYTIRI